MIKLLLVFFFVLLLWEVKADSEASSTAIEFIPLEVRPATTHTPPQNSPTSSFTSLEISNTTNLTLLEISPTTSFTSLDISLTTSPLSLEISPTTVLPQDITEVQNDQKTQSTWESLSETPSALDDSKNEKVKSVSNHQETEENASFRVDLSSEISSRNVSQEHNRPGAFSGKKQEVDGMLKVNTTTISTLPMRKTETTVTDFTGTTMKNVVALRPSRLEKILEELSNAALKSITVEHIDVENLNQGEGNSIEDSAGDILKNKTFKSIGIRTTNSFNNSIAKSIETGNTMKNEFPNSSDHESNNHRFSKLDNINSDKEKLLNITDKTNIKENSTAELDKFTEGKENPIESQSDIKSDKELLNTTDKTNIKESSTVELNKFTEGQEDPTESQSDRNSDKEELLNIADLTNIKENSKEELNEFTEEKENPTESQSDRNSNKEELLNITDLTDIKENSTVELNLFTGKMENPTESQFERNSNKEELLNIADLTNIKENSTVELNQFAGKTENPTESQFDKNSNKELLNIADLTNIKENSTSELHHFTEEKENPPESQSDINSDKELLNITDLTYIKENSTAKLSEFTEEKENPIESQSDIDDFPETDITRGDLSLRKCCEDHEYFSLETQQCEEGKDDLGFTKTIKDTFLPDSVINIETENGRLPACPGTTDPPLVSQPTNYTYSIDASGHVTDMTFGLTYDHNHYCLELAGYPSEAPVLVLAHCHQTDSSEIENLSESSVPVPAKVTDLQIKENFENLKSYSFENGSSKIPDDLLVRKCCEDHEFFSLSTQHCEDAARDVNFKYFVHETLLQDSTSDFKTHNGRLPICPGTTEPPLVMEATSDLHSIGVYGQLSDASTGMEYDHDHYCLELAAQNPEELHSPVFLLAYCLPFGKEAFSESLIKTSVRKCCKEHEFYSIRSQTCEPAGGDPGFLDKIRKQIVGDNSSTEFQPITGLLKACPDTGEPPLIDEVKSFTHTLHIDGHLEDHYTAVIYDQDHYCLELAASSHDLLAEAPIALAYCVPGEKENYRIPPAEVIVRKCCAEDEYFSTRTQRCELSGDDKEFENRVRSILIDNVSNLSYMSGKIQWCPSSRDLPEATVVQTQTYALSAFGHLKELHTGVRYDHENYCLELGADSSHELYNAELIASYCPIFNAHILIRKCCNLNQYMDSTSRECLDRLGNMTNYNYLIREFHHSDPVSTTITVGKLKCKNGPMKRVDADSTYLNEAGQLCEHSNGICHPSSAYCIESFGKHTDTSLESSAFVCPTNVFNKCCPPDEVLSADGCVKHTPEYIASSHMNQLTEILLPQFGMPTVGEKNCEVVMIRSSGDDTRWWVNKAGYLSLRSKNGKTTTKHYCVDDYKISETEKETVAIICVNEVDHILSTQFLSSSGNTNSIGKCCSQGQYLGEDYTCIENTLGLDLLKEPEFVAANVTELAYTAFPVCQSKTEQVSPLHPYPFGQRSDDDYAILQEDQTMSIVSLENGCFLHRQAVRNRAYCIDYVIAKEMKEVMILVCTDQWQFKAYQEKYSLTAVLLGISCTALTATAFSLISMRVRRGLVTVKKVNTLAGRILLSYVISYLLAFLLLAVGMKASPEAGHTCSVLAGFLMFFLLSAFQWNTSICLESLLLTLRVSTSERNRYLCHSVWAWGIPGIITTVALTLDHHRANLPCSVITPKIGLYRCFFSDSVAQLLYLYVPMFVSLCANMILLLAARYMRSAKLRRLEKGGRKQTTVVANAEGTELQEQQSKTSDQNTSQVSSQPNGQHSGLRTHQSRNLWTESMKLVVWSGVTWMAEVVSFVITRFFGLSESWYNYLWYLPSSINSLRGVGIFVILVLTPENRHKIFKMVGNFGPWAGSGSMARHSRSGDGHSTSGNHHSSIAQGRGSEMRPTGRRNMSIATTLTQISSVRSGTSSEIRHETGNTVRVHPKVAHSVSQIDTRRGSVSSQSSDGENCESDTEVTSTGGGGRRKSSLANFALLSLPSVDEEEDVFEGTSHDPHPTTTPTVSSSDV